uniref:Uncharacterized protein n=1 Tax=Spongospora subterranea TaxID=70186 RepID=A0A0H5QI31_9EUKA|eukprot:CRZ01643.1 hypothetical protein [Spongospora subterranea]
MTIIQKKAYPYFLSKLSMSVITWPVSSRQSYYQFSSGIDDTPVMGSAKFIPYTPYNAVPISSTNSDRIGVSCQNRCSTLSSYLQLTRTIYRSVGRLCTSEPHSSMTPRDPASGQYPISIRIIDPFSCCLVDNLTPSLCLSSSAMLLTILRNGRTFR